VKSAQEQTRQVLERVKSGVREATYWTLLMWMKNLRQAAMQRDWPRALLFAEECPAVGERLVQAEGLSPASARACARGSMMSVCSTPSSEANGSRERQQLLDLDNAQSKALDDLIHLLEALGGRPAHEPTKDPTP